MDLAESYTVNRSNTRYTFKLRPSIKFSDGTPITAADVRYSWTRALAMSEPWSIGRQIFGSVAGAYQLIEGESDELSGIVVADDRTLILETIAPMPLLPDFISHPVASILKKRERRRVARPLGQRPVPAIGANHPPSIRRADSRQGVQRSIHADRGRTVQVIHLLSL